MPDDTECAVAADLADRFLRGEQLTFAEANALWAQLKKCDELSRARRVVRRMRRKRECLSERLPSDPAIKDTLCRQEALLTSKDPELHAATRHDDALELLSEGFAFIDNKALPGDGETLGIAGGICKRRWNDLGQLKDLIQAAELYERGTQSYGTSEKPLGDDAYPHINAAFLEDLLAAAGDQPDKRRQRATELRERIVRELAPSGTWFNAATRAEALFGLRKYPDATAVIAQLPKPALWELRTMAEQLAQLAHLHEEHPLEDQSIRTFFETLLPGAGDAVRGVIIGKVGLALSGGGFRASFYHLGVLACLAERDVLRDVEVLSCVSGGSIVGACYWLKLRERMLRPGPLTREDYVTLVGELIAHFEGTVQKNLRAQVQPYVLGIAWRFLRGEKGVLDPEKTAIALEDHFYRPLWPGNGPITMDQLAFLPTDHSPALTGSRKFNPGRHNWLRAHKVPALILNATTVNTGHAWHFTPTWMGELPWAIHETADSIPRLQWAEYDTHAGWQMRLGRAVAASAGVPTVFAPLRLGKFYQQKVEVTLVDGGVHDNQGTVPLLASGCNVILVSDACGQLMLEDKPPTGLKGLVKSTTRSMDTLMERVRLANFAELDARRRSGLLRGLMFLHMKAGLDADVVQLSFAQQEAYDREEAPLSRSGVTKDFQRTLAELRTDLDRFTDEESRGLMACGYKMATKTIEEQLPKLRTVWRATPHTEWPFQAMLGVITSVANTTEERRRILAALQQGSNVDFLGSSPNRLVRGVLPAWRKLKSAVWP